METHEASTVFFRPAPAEPRPPSNPRLMSRLSSKVSKNSLEEKNVTPSCGARASRSLRLVVSQVVFAQHMCAQTVYTWEQVREKFRASNPTIQAAQLNVSESRAAEITAYLRPILISLSRPTAPRSSHPTASGGRSPAPNTPPASAIFMSVTTSANCAAIARVTPPPLPSPRSPIRSGRCSSICAARSCRRCRRKRSSR